MFNFRLTSFEYSDFDGLDVGILLCRNEIDVALKHLSSVQPVTLDRVDEEETWQKLVSGLIGALGTGQGENESGVN